MSTDSRMGAISLMTVLAALAVLAASVTGILHKEIYRGVVSADFLPGTVSQDIISALAALGLLGALAAVRRGSRRATVVWAGLMAYVLYAYGLYSFEGIYNPLFLLYVAALGLSVFSLILFFWRTDRRELPSSPKDGRGLAAAVAVFLIVLSLAFVLIWLSVVIPAAASRVRPEGNAIFVLDLSFFLPLLVTAAVMLLRGKESGDFLAGAALVMMAALGTSVLLGILIAPAFGKAVDMLMAALFFVLGPGSALLAALWLSRLDERMPGGRGVRDRW